MKILIISTITCFFLLPSVAYSQETLVSRLTQHVYTLADDTLKGRDAGSIYAQKAADYIVAQWEEIGITPWNGVSYSMPFTRNRAEYVNLVGIFEGNHPVLKHEYIIVGAHYDHIGYITDPDGELIIYNGADDNASGTAVIIELGRKLKEIQHTLGRTVVLVAFDAEEIGLHGSNYLANSTHFPIENVKLMFSIDMVGWYEASGYLRYLGSGTIKDGKQFVLNSEHIPEGLNVTTKKFGNMINRTDTHGFYMRGRPALALSTGMKSPYHKPEDMAHLIDYEGMALVTQHVFNLVQAVSNDEDFTPSGKIASHHRPPSGKVSFALSANVGANHHHYTRGALRGKTAGAYGIGLAMRTNSSPIAAGTAVYYDFIQARHPSGKISSHSVTVPLNLVVQSQPVQLNGVAAFAGAYYSYRFSGKQGASELDFDNGFNRNEFGINFGYDIRLNPISLGLTFRRAFTNFSHNKNSDGSHLRNRALFVTLNYHL